LRLAVGVDQDIVSALDETVGQLRNEQFGSTIRDRGNGNEGRGDKGNTHCGNTRYGDSSDGINKADATSSG
jgi:hypothetical protein